jgi:hypothetical protein
MQRIIWVGIAVLIALFYVYAIKKGWIDEPYFP